MEVRLWRDVVRWRRQPQWLGCVVVVVKAHASSSIVHGVWLLAEGAESKSSCRRLSVRLLLQDSFRLVRCRRVQQPLRVQRRCDGERGVASRRTSEHALHCTDEHAQVGRPREAVWRSTRYILRTACSGFAPATPMLHLTVGTRVVAASPAVPSALPTLALAVHLSRPTRVPGRSCAPRARVSTPLGNCNGGVTEKDQKRGGYHSAYCSFLLPLDVALGVETGRCSACNPFERESHGSASRTAAPWLRIPLG